MKKSLRSYLCLFLALSLTLAAGLPAFATPPVPQPPSGPHPDARH